MGLLIGAGVVLLSAAAFLLCHFLVQRGEARFEQEKRPGRAVVDHYSRQSEHGSALTMMVRIPELSERVTYSCTTGPIDRSRYPEGTVIDVLYRPYRVLGLQMADIRMAGAAAKQRGTKVFVIISAVLLIAALGLAAAGLVQIL